MQGKLAEGAGGSSWGRDKALQNSRGPEKQLRVAVKCQEEKVFWKPVGFT